MPPVVFAPPDTPIHTFTIDLGGPRLGTQVSSMSPELRDFFGAPADAGILVQRVEPGSAAEAAKVKVGDVLVEIDGHRIADASDVREALRDRGGKEVSVVVIRKGKRKTLKAPVPESSPAFEMPEIPPMPEIPRLELPPELERFMTPEQRQEVERELDRAREELREVERQLEALAEHTDDEDHAPARAPKKTKRKAKAKRKTKAKRDR